MIKIIFICGSIEPGLDGVGDYTRRLSIELIRRGYQVAIIALNDHYQFYLENTYQEENGITISILRIPSSLSVSQRYIIAKQFIISFNPQWLSLQYVPYSFQNKGLPFRMGKRLKTLEIDCKWHIMFHELWLCPPTNNSFKDLLVGYFQKRILRKIILYICPLTSFTSNYFYRSKLTKLGIDVKVFPIFSNISFDDNLTNGIYKLLPSHILENRNNYFILTFFGTVNPDNNFYDNIRHLSLLAEQNKKKILITHIGHSSGIDNVLDNIKSKTGIEVFSFNSRSVQEISNYFRYVDFALSTHPKLLFEKSGTISAFLSCGLNVILLNKSNIKDTRNIIGLYELDELSDLLQISIQPKDFSSKYNFINTVNGYEKFLTSI